MLKKQAINFKIMRDKYYINNYLEEVKKIVQEIDRKKIFKIVKNLKELRKRNGRLFILGVGGSAANASHAVNDFRKISKIESYTPVDNISELTAWTNDNGFEFVFINWLKESKFNKNDALLIFSVGGGSQKTSKNLVLAMKYAKRMKAKILGIVSRDGGATKKLADVCLLIPVVNPKRITPHAEEWQVIIWHLIANALK